MKRFLILLIIFGIAGCGSVKTRDEIKEGGGASEPSGSDVIQASDGVAPSQATFAQENEKKTSGRQLWKAMDEAFKNQDYDGMQRAAVNALSQNPKDMKALAALGVVNQQRKKYLAAMYFYNKALQQGPGPSEIHNNIGMIQLALGERKEAIKAFKKAFDTNPSDAIAAANLGSIYAVEGDYVKALPPLQRAVKGGIKDSRVYNNYGIALTASSQYDEAKTIYEEAIRLSNSNREALFNYAILMIDHLNKPQAGLDAIQKLRFMGLGEGMRERINSLENKAKAGLK